MNCDSIHSTDHVADPAAASPPAPASGPPPQYSAPFLRVEIRVSCVCESDGIEVPLGYRDGGLWVAPPFVDDHVEINQDDLAERLSQEQVFGPPLAFSREHGAAMVRDTFERCRALAEASARNRTPAI
jgi:hypothetical protein